MAGQAVPDGAPNIIIENPLPLLAAGFRGVLETGYD